MRLTSPIAATLLCQTLVASPLLAEGRSIIHLEVGEPDFATADHQAQPAPDVVKRRQVVHQPCTALRISGTSTSGRQIPPDSANSCARGDIFRQVLLMICSHFSSLYSGCFAAKLFM